MRERLDRYVAQFGTAESNSRYYRWPADAARTPRRRRLPAGFRLSVKAPRGLTHVRRLYEPERWLARVAGGLARLGERRAPLLVQLSSRFALDHARLAYFLAYMPPGLEVAFEFRHPSWHTERVFELRERHGAAYRRSRSLTIAHDRSRS